VISNGGEPLTIVSFVPPEFTQLSHWKMSLTLLAGCMKARSVKSANPRLELKIALVVPVRGWSVNVLFGLTLI
jgi:hypothetical protein